MTINVMTLGVPEMTHIDAVDGAVEIATSDIGLGVGTARRHLVVEEFGSLKDQSPGEQSQSLMTPGEVAQLFRVDPKTVSRWAISGRVGSVRTPGGHRRFQKSEVEALLAALTQEAVGQV